MNRLVVQRILGLLLMMFSITMVPPVIVDLIYKEQSWTPFVESFGLTLFVGLLLWYPVRDSRKDLRLREKDQVIIAHHDTVIETDDHVILFMTDRRKVDRLEKLFQVGVSFI